MAARSNRDPPGCITRFDTAGPGDGSAAAALFRAARSPTGVEITASPARRKKSNKEPEPTPESVMNALSPAHDRTRHANLKSAEIIP
jgi:hypothetical protein